MIWGCSGRVGVILTRDWEQRRPSALGEKKFKVPGAGCWGDPAAPPDGLKGGLEKKRT